MLSVVCVVCCLLVACFLLFVEYGSVCVLLFIVMVFADRCLIFAVYCMLCTASCCMFLCCVFIVCRCLLCVVCSVRCGLFIVRCSLV